jgi:hypothetical protein
MAKYLVELKGAIARRDVVEAPSEAAAGRYGWANEQWSAGEDVRQQVTVLPVNQQSVVNATLDAEGNRIEAPESNAPKPDAA